MKQGGRFFSRLHWTEAVGGVAALALTIAGFRAGGWVSAVSLMVACVVGLAIWHVLFVDPPLPQSERRGTSLAFWAVLKGDGTGLMSRGGGAFLASVGSALVLVMLSSGPVSSFGVLGLFAFGVAILQVCAGVYFVFKPKRSRRAPPA